VSVTTDWPVAEFGVGLREAVAGRSPSAMLEHDDGLLTPMNFLRWCAQPDDADLSVIRRVRGTTLDIGCGPGRLTVALAAARVPTLGIDVARAAIDITRAAGGFALHRSIFSPIPGEGTWRTVLLVDGNIGIGGDPVRLLHRVANLLCSGGRALVELEPPGTNLHLGSARIRAEHQHDSGWFGWARVPVGSIGALGGLAGLRLSECWSVHQRWFAALDRTAR
jgi:SAM-dependent methyltransferase